MRKTFFTLFALVAILGGAWSSAIPNVWPMPQSISQGNETYIISNPCELSYQVHSVLPTKLKGYYTEAVKFFERIQLSEHCQETTGDLPKSNFYWSSSLLSTRFMKNAIHILVKDPQVVPMVPGTTSEAYSLSINEKGIQIDAETYVGFTRAMATLSQLVTTENGVAMVKNTPILVQDSPRYPYRGIMIDTARHFISVDTLLKFIDALSLNKLNVFHWHISDSDSFPMEMPSHPNMTNGVFSKNQIYTREDVQRLVAHAKVRGVAIVPELDAPSHSRSWGEASEWTNYLTCLAPGFPYFGIPLGMLDVTQDRTYELLQDLYNDLQKGYFKEFKHIHLGADEVVKGCVDTIPGIEDFKKAHDLNNYEDVFAYFVKRSKDLVANETRRIYWSNLETLYLKFEDRDLIQWWGDTAGLEQGFSTYPNNQFILSNFDYFYLDVGMGNYFGNASWSSYNTWGHIYSFEPDTLIQKEEWRKRVFGGELAMWEELGNDFTMGTKVWPRGIAFAEKMWSSKNCTGSDRMNMFIRMNTQNNRLIGLGIPAGPASTGYCEHHPDDCGF